MHLTEMVVFSKTADTTMYSSQTGQPRPTKKSRIPHQSRMPTQKSRQNQRKRKHLAETCPLLRLSHLNEMETYGTPSHASCFTVFSNASKSLSFSRRVLT